MKKQLLFNFTKYLTQKMTFRMAAFAVLFLMTVQSSFAQQWDYLGKENEVSPLISGYSTIVVVNESGVEVPYVGFAENAPLAYPVNNQTAPGAGVLIVKKRLADGTWQKVGQTITNSGLHMRIYTNSLNELFVGYIDATNSSKLAVRKYNAGTNSWDALGGNSANLLVSTGSANSGYPPNSGNTIQRLSISFDANNMLYVAYSEPSNVVTIKRFNTTLATPAWETVGNGTTAPNVNIATGVSSSVAVVGTDVFISYLNMGGATLAGSIKLYKLDSATIGNAWTEITVPAGATNTSLFGRYLTMISNGNNLCFAYANTVNGTKAHVAFYNPTAASGTEWSGFWSIGSGDCRNISLIRDSAGNLYCSFIDAINSSYFSSQRVRFLKAGGNAWSELKNPLVIRGVDESANWSAIGIANGSTVPHVVYVKRSSTTATLTPIVRKYISPVNAPVITSYAFATNTTVTPNVVTLTINGSNFTGATDISLNGASANGVPSPFTVVDDTQITYVVPGATVAPAFSQLTVSTPNGTATLNATPPSALTYAAYPATYNGNPIVVSSVTPSDLLLYSITSTPALPAGLSIARDSGTISGQSTTVTSPTNYTVTVTNSFGSATAILNFATAGSAPSGLTYTPAVSASYTADTAITPLVATTTNGTGATYTVIPALPAGLMLNSTTGEITGTPTVAADFKNYEVKATTPLGFTSRVIAFAITAPLATESFQKSDAIIAYPNPTTDSVTVSLPNAAVVQKIAVYNSLGQLVCTEAKDTVSLQNLANGHYYLTIYTAEGNYSKKIIKK